MNKCKNCRFWDEGVCDKPDQGEDERPGDDGVAIRVRVADDHNLQVDLLTGPEFGCAKFEQK